MRGPWRGRGYRRRPPRRRRRPQNTWPDSRPRRRGHIDRVVGVIIGLILGMAIVVGFVFLSSEGTIDAPSLSRGDLTAAGEQPATTGPSGPTGATGSTGFPAGFSGSTGASGPPAIAPVKNPVVRIAGGAPPVSGPVLVRFTAGRNVSMSFSSDAANAIEIPGYGIAETIPAGDSVLRFRTTRKGQFPVIVSASHIEVATLRVSAP